ncbi:MAG: hypothetical protein ACE5KV_06180 [Thermoplasmata archaeon]
MHDSLIPPIRGLPDEVLDTEEMIERFELDPSKKKADSAAHFPKCPWIIVESKSRGHIRKAVEQLEETMKQIDRGMFDVQNVAVVYESLGEESRLYAVARREGPKRILYLKTVGRGRPVEVEGIEVEAYTRNQVKHMYTRLDIGQEG